MNLRWLRKLDSSFVAITLWSAGCGSGSPPQAVTDFTVGTALTWSAVPSATSYNLYTKVVAKDLGLVTPEEAVVTLNDTKIPNVTSPYSLAQDNKCHTAYLFGITAMKSYGESGLAGPMGHGPPNSDCVP